MIPIMRFMKIQPEKRLALFLLTSVSLVWGQTGTSGRAADSSAPPTSFPAPTPAALATGEHAISGHDPGPSVPSPVTDLLKLLLANVNSTEAMTSMKAIWATDRYFDFARFQETAKNVAEMMRQAGLDDVQTDLLLVVGEPRDYHAGETGSREGSWKRRRLYTFQLFDHTTCNGHEEPHPD
jgi:hypothetical protein